MNYREFFDRLENVASSYHWNVEHNDVVARIQSGTFRGFALNPITALAHKAGFGFFNNNKKDTLFAGRLLGLSTSFAEHVYEATKSYHNRGNTQVVRGRIRSALEV
jgi:hypothetical protein